MPNWPITRLIKARSLLNSPVHSDLIIKCDGSAFYAHQCILGLLTDYFDAAVLSRSPELETNTVSILHHSAATVWRFLSWCYSGDYPQILPDQIPQHKAHEGVQIHMRVSLLADYLGVDELKTVALDRCRYELANNWKADVFLEAVRDVFPSTGRCNDDTLRRVILTFGGMNHATLKTVPGYRDVLDQVEGFAAELAWGYI